MTPTEQLTRDRANSERLIDNGFAKDASLGDIHQRLGDSLGDMIEIQMQSYPVGWSEDDKREMAEQHLFGKGE